MSLADDCRTAALAVYDLSTVSPPRAAEAFLHCRSIFTAAADELERLEAALSLRHGESVEALHWIEGR